MKAEQAIRLIRNGVQSEKPEIWADLGCGAGTFTAALANLLVPESKIIGVDISVQHLPKSVNEVQIGFLKADFLRDELILPKSDGILMANSFHFVKDKISFIRKIEKLLRDEKKFLIVEYNNPAPNPFVPYPLPFESLVELFSGLNYSEINKLGEINSVYGGKIYAALVQY